MHLRPYQQKAIDDLYAWLRKNKGHPVIVLPTGSGKSVVIAELCRNALQNWPETRILMLTHVKELLEQNAEKLRSMWPNAPIGMYSASLGRKDLDAITFAGIQSIGKKAEYVGHVDLVIIDEAHTVGHKDEGLYRAFLADLEKINPRLRIIGLTATPYRLGHGLITDKPAIFDDILEPARIPQLMAQGYLSRLVSKHTTTQLSVEGVHKRGGEYIESELQAAMDTGKNNSGVVDEVMLKAGDRKAWLFFCAGVDHAYHIRDLLIEKGITAATVTGETSKGERERILEEFKAGTIRALTNANVLTTGFDYPGIDLIAFLRPTMSKGLYIQMAGRGLRVKPHTDHCLILDFAGLVAQHGPITSLDAEHEKSDGEKEPGAPPCKNCPECGEIVFISTMTCPACGYQFPIVEKKLTLRNDDIMGEPETFHVTSWSWSVQTSKNSGKEMLVVTYYGDVGYQPIKEYLCLWHDGYAGQKALRLLAEIAKECGVDDYNDTVNLERADPPARLKYVKDGKFFRVVGREWEVPF